VLLDGGVRRGMSILRRLVGRLPLRYQQELKRLHFARLIRHGSFSSESHDVEYDRLHEWVRRSDWVIDVGANIGIYTAKLSEIVKASGRVFALEPMPEMFELLAANMAQCPLRNITLLNVAASDEVALRGMTVPKLESGLPGYPLAHLSDDGGEVAVMCLPLDMLCLPERIALIKIDVEGHELRAIKGMKNLIARDHPVLIVEGLSDDIASYLRAFGYSFEQAAGSPNRVFRPVSGPR